MEDQLSSILATIEHTGQLEHQRTLERKREEEEKQELLRIRMELKQRKEMELNDFKAVLADAERWRQTEMLRKYIDTVQQRATQDQAMTEELGE